MLLGGGVNRYHDTALYSLLNSISSLALFAQRAQQKPHAHYYYAHLQLHTSLGKWLSHVCMLFYFSVFVISAAIVCRNCKFILFIREVKLGGLRGESSRLNIVSGGKIIALSLKIYLTVDAVDIHT